MRRIGDGAGGVCGRKFQCRHVRIGPSQDLPHGERRQSLEIARAAVLGQELGQRRPGQAANADAKPPSTARQVSPAHLR